MLDAPKGRAVPVGTACIWLCALCVEKAVPKKIGIASKPPNNKRRWDHDHRFEIQSAQSGAQRTQRRVRAARGRGGFASISKPYSNIAGLADSLYWISNENAAVAGQRESAQVNEGRLNKVTVAIAFAPQPAPGPSPGIGSGRP